MVFAVNGWATLRYGRGPRSQMLARPDVRPKMCDSFIRLLSETASPLGIYGGDFARYWPIFEAKDLRRSPHFEAPR